MADRKSQSLQEGDRVNAASFSWKIMDQQTSDDDDDEPRLMIDTSEDEEETNGNFSVRHGMTTTRAPMDNMKFPPGFEKAILDVQNDQSIFDPNSEISIYTPLSKLQELVRKPFPNSFPSKTLLPNMKISSALIDGSHVCDLKSTNIVTSYPLNLNCRSEVVNDAVSYSMPPSYKSKSRSQSKADTTLLTLPSKIKSKSQNLIINEAKTVSVPKLKSRLDLVNQDQHLPRPPQLTSAPGIQKHGLPTLSIINTFSSNTPPPPPPPLQKRPSKIDYVLNKLRTAAKEEEQMQQLRIMQLQSAEGEEFRRFQAFLKARLKTQNLDISPIGPSKNVFSRPIDSERVRVPPPAAHSFSSKTGSVNHPMPLPPALTVIPKDGVDMFLSRRSNCRRSPPPMVPIESLASLRKPINEDRDNVVYRLKRLGTDIELERTGPPSPPQYRNYGENDDDDPIPIDVDCVLSTEPIVTIDERPNWFPMKTYGSEHSPPNNILLNRNPPPPPPSLIPITCSTSLPPTSKYVPILPHPSRDDKLKKLTPPVIEKKRRKRAKLSFKSEFAKLAHALVQPAGATKKIDANVISSLCSAAVIEECANREKRLQTALVEKKQKEVTIERVVDKPIQKLVEKLAEIPLEKSAKKTVEQHIEKLTGNLVDTSTENHIEKSIEKLTENSVEKPMINIFCKNEEKLKEKSVAETSTVKTEVTDKSKEREKMTKKQEEKEPQNLNDKDIEKTEELVSETLKGKPVVITMSDNSKETLPPSVQGKQFFVFTADQAALPSELPNGRKRYTCKICSGVYCKMSSLKKHYFRYHVNPRMASEPDAIKFGLVTSAKEGIIEEGMFRCNECNKIFIEKEDLKSHLLDHPPISLDGERRRSVDQYRCDGCKLIFRKKKMFTRHEQECSSVTKLPSSEFPAVVSVSSPSLLQLPTMTSSFVDLKDEVEAESMIVDETAAELSKNEKQETEVKKGTRGISMMCLFCELTFTNTTARKRHVLQNHHPKRKQQTCTYCKNKKFSDLRDLLKHICEAHSKRYFGCAICKIRFKTKNDLMAHNAESHPNQDNIDMSSSVEEKMEVKSVATTVVGKNGKTHKCGKCLKTFNTSSDLKKHRKKIHSDPKTSGNKVVANSNVTTGSDCYEQKYRNTVITSADYETQFYINVAKNVKFNVEICMDGRIEANKTNDLKNSTRSNTAFVPRDDRESESELTLCDMYGSANMNGNFIRNVCRLHLATQLSMLRKANLLDKDPSSEVGSSSAFRSTTSMAKELALKEKSGSLSIIEKTEENSGNNDVSFSGEWIRSKKYICAACFTRFNNFWDMEDHRWIKHPNVWGFYYEFVTDQAPGVNWAMKRSLQSCGALGKISDRNSSAISTTSFTCSKCRKVVSPEAEFHKHILECGGDTTWMSTMFAASSMKRHKKWRPYGSRRRRNIARVRGLKRNIPTTPIKIIGLSRSRQKAGDSETIQKMIANLPPKRITRRIIQFDDIESRSVNRTNNDINVLTRKRKERLDAKTTAQIAKAFTTDNMVLIKQSESKKDKKKTTNCKSPTPTDDPLDAFPKKAKNGSKLKPTKTDSSSHKIAQGVQDSTSPLMSDTENSAKNNASSITIGSVVVVETLSEREPKETEEEPELNLETIEPADTDTPSLPDSSIILAAMRETMRQTDAVIPNQTFISKKRKREEAKCKKCGIKQENLTGSLCETCVELDAKRPAVIATIVCKECKLEILGVFEDGNSVCENCSTKRETRSRRSSVIIKSKDTSTGNKTFAKNKCHRCNSPLMDSECSNICDKCNHLGEIACSLCKRLFVKKANELLCSKCTESKKDAVPPVICENVISVSQVTDIATAPVIGEVLCSVCSKPCSNSNSASQMCIECSAEPATVETAMLSNITNDTAAKKETEPVCNLKSTCKVCHREASSVVCRNCAAVSRKLKICARCRQRWEDPEKTSIPVCVKCQDGWYQFESENRSHCRVCLRDSSNVVCDTCTGMARRHRMCARCNLRWDEHSDSAMPVCLSCQKQWYPEDEYKNEDFLQKCADCAIMHSNEVTLRRLCDRCSTSKKPVVPVNERRSSSEVSIQVNEVNEEMVPALANHAFASALPTKIVKSSTDESPEKINGSPSKKNVILICKGCYGLFDTVSSYKQHCETCQARVSCLDTDKKPLLGFAKRNAKGGVDIAPADTNGASFEIIEGVQIRSSDEVPDNMKIESSVSEGVVPIIAHAADLTLSSKRTSELNKSPKVKRSYASDESITSTIESVIKTVCYDLADKVTVKCEPAEIPSNPEIISCETSVASSENIDQSTMCTNFEKVKTALANSLETSKVNEVLIKEVSFTKSESSVSGSELDEAKLTMVVPAKKKKKLIKKNSKPNPTRTTRSQFKADAENVSHRVLRNQQSFCETKRNKTNSKKRKAVDNVDTQEEGTSEEKFVPVEPQLLQKPPAEARVLRSRARVTESRHRLSEKESRVGIESGKSESETNTENFAMRCEPNALEKTEKMYPENKIKDSDDVTEETSLMENMIDNGSKIKSLKRKSEIPRQSNNLSTVDSNNDLGFAVKKSCKNTHSSFKSHSTTDIENLKNESEAIESELIRKRSYELDVNFRQAETVKKEPVENSEIKGADANPEERYFLGMLSSLTPVSADEQMSINNFAYNKLVPTATTTSTTSTPTAMTISDGYESNEPQYFDPNHSDVNSSTTWYSDYMSFNSLVDDQSLGSIINSVHELLTRPEVVMSCGDDDKRIDALQQDVMMMLHGYSDAPKKDYNSVEQGDDTTPTFVDLDQQSACSSDSESKSKKYAASDDLANVTLDKIKEVIVCNSNQNSNDSQVHQTSTDHQNGAMDTSNSTNPLNGRLRSSNKSNRNGINTKLRCSHCQKVLTGKADMAIHIKEHLKTFAMSKSDNANFMKKCISEKLESILLNKALDNYIKSPNEASLRNSLPLKILNQLSQAKKNQFAIWKTAIAQMLVDSSASPSANSETNEDPPSSANRAMAKGPTKSAARGRMRASAVCDMFGVEKGKVPDSSDKNDGYPCPMCPMTFQYTNMRNQHLIMVHAPRQSTHKHLKESSIAAATKKKDNLSKPTINTSGNENVHDAREKIINSYLLNDSVNACESKRESQIDISDSRSKSLDQFRQTFCRMMERVHNPKLDDVASTSTATSITESQAAELPPALEPALNNEHLSSHAHSYAERSPPKLEAPAGLPKPLESGIRKLTSVLSKSTTPPKKKPCRKKISKKEIDLPPAIVKMKAEQALLELSKFQKLR